jgi:hypothetical protein
MRFRFAFAIALLGAGIIAACASGDLASQDGGVGGDPGVDGSVDAATDGTGVSASDAGGRRDSAAAPDTSLPDQPDTGAGGLDSAPPVTDSGSSTGLDATSDAPIDAPADAPSDAGVDAAPDAGPDTGAPDCGAPGGSYAASCPTCSLAGTTLTCACKDDAQDADITTLNICGCAQPPVITNNNGVLSCPAP